MATNVRMPGTIDPYIHDFTREEPLESFVSTNILVDASYYLQQILDSSNYQEPLLAAMGGPPMALKEHISKDLDLWTAHQMKPTFIFNGQQTVGTQTVRLRIAQEAARNTEAAWNMYRQNNANEAVMKFGVSHAVFPDDMYPMLQEILISRGVRFKTAVHNACAQIAYYDSQDICNDAIMASTELLLYPISDTCLILKLDFTRNVAHGLVRSELLRSLGVSEDTFVDSLLMTGTSSLSTFPILRDLAIVPSQPPSIRDAINMYRTSGRSIFGVCDAFDVEIKALDPQWKSNCLKAKMALNHYIYHTPSGKVVVHNEQHLTHDNTEYLGMQLPHELYGFLESGVCRHNIINLLSSQHYTELPPLAGAEQPEYQKLVTEQLPRTTEQALTLLTGRMHRAFQVLHMDMNFWYDDNKVVRLNQQISPKPQTLVNKWNVKASLYGKHESKHSRPGSLEFAITSLRNKEFAKSTITPEAPKGLQSETEVIVNTLWRFLHLRGYINDQHELTPWGEAAAIAIGKLRGSGYADANAILLAFELLKYDQLNVRNLHEDLVGNVLKGSDSDKRSCLLIARCAALLQLRHKSIGYTGPLSKNLLAWHAIVDAVRRRDRDLIETVFACVFLYGQADRSMEYRTIGSSLPCKQTPDIALSIAVKTFLDCDGDVDLSEDQRVLKREEYSKSYLPHAVNFPQDLERAFSFFDAIAQAVDGLEELGSQRQAFRDAKVYLDARRAKTPVSTPQHLSNGI